MKTENIRDQKIDQLITPENVALVVIDYQPTQINSIKSIDTTILTKNIVGVAKLAKLFNIPIILTTVNDSGDDTHTIPELNAVLEGHITIKRTTINSWEDKKFYEAVKSTGKNKLIMTALWTEACLTFPTLDALKEGFEVYPVVDAVGGTSSIAHDTALRRVEQAGAQLISTVQIACELQRDWSRIETVSKFVEIMKEINAF